MSSSIITSLPKGSIYRKLSHVFKSNLNRFVVILSSNAAFEDWEIWRLQQKQLKHSLNMFFKVANIDPLYSFSPSKFEYNGHQKLYFLMFLKN